MKKIITAAAAFLPFLLFAQSANNDPVTSASSWTGSPVTQATGTISDSIDILNYNISLNITDFTTDTIRGGTTIHYAARVNNITVLPLDLLHMTIDSIVENSGQLTYSYNDTLLSVNLPAAMNIGDTADMAVYYHGKPQMDPSGWGGFYFQGTCATISALVSLSIRTTSAAPGSRVSIISSSVPPMFFISVPTTGKSRSATVFSPVIRQT
ncbi:MAG TPA: hypothetical protein VFU15_05070 [Bacteroidia bacterium]|nr:hypothetical protein [Bacteroidia bacterium]